METTSELIKCLICGLHNCNSEEQLAVNRENDSSLISKHLQVIFLLRNILEVPSSKLVIFLKSHPKLESWLSICANCTKMVNNCKTIYQAILDEQKKFRTVKQEVIQVLKRSALVKKEISHDDEEPDNYYDKPLDIVEDIRVYVSQNRYPKNVDPFISGDHQAYQKLSQKLDKALEQLEDEDNQSWTNDNLLEDLHQDWIPSEDHPADIPAKITKKQMSKLKTRSKPPPSRAIKNNWVRGTFPCKSCPKTFPYKKYLTRHISTIHSLSTSSTCPTCGASFPNPINLVSHQTGKCTGKSLPCPEPTCPIKLASQTSLTNHLLNIHGPSILQKHKKSRLPRALQRNWTLGSFSCQLCPKIFPYQNYLDRHIASMHSLVSSAVCDICGATLPTASTLSQHQVRCTGKSIPCPVADCPIKSTTQAALTNHLRNIHDPGAFEEFRKTCEFCGKIFSKTNSLKAHITLKHAKKDKFKCDLCGVRKSTNSDLKKHRENCKGESLSCPVLECQLKFVNYTALNNHVRAGHSERMAELLPFKCNVCEDYNGYLTEKQLKYHMSHKHPHKKGERFDTSLGPFICETCGESYANKYLMQNHRRSSVKCNRLRGEVNREAEEVICEICGGRFKGKGCLGRHVRVVHLKKFTMNCEICGQGKNGRVRMEIHMWQKHKVGDERKWRCGVEGCGVQIFGGRDREDHMRKHRGEEPGYRCEECGKGFYMRVNIRQHVREVHEGKRVKGKGRGKERGLS